METILKFFAAVAAAIVLVVSPKPAVMPASGAAAVSEEQTSAQAGEEAAGDNAASPGKNTSDAQAGHFDLLEVPAYSGDLSVEMNGGVPYSLPVYDGQAYVHFGDQDHLGRSTAGEAILGREIFPKDSRNGIDPDIKPSGWKQAHYDFIHDNDGFLYQRCHIIGWQLCGDEQTPANLFTGTVAINLYGMLPYENEVAGYIRETGNHVAYRVTPVYEGDDLVCRGVLMEAASIEDDGVGFCVFCYNVQDYVVIDYATGSSLSEQQEAECEIEKDYVLNKRSMKIHLPDCEAVPDISKKNREDVHASKKELVEEGYSPCGICKP